MLGAVASRQLAGVENPLRLGVAFCCPLLSVNIKWAGIHARASFCSFERCGNLTRESATSTYHTIAMSAYSDLATTA